MLLSKDRIEKISDSYKSECLRYGINFDTESPCLAVIKKEAWQLKTKNENIGLEHYCPLPENVESILSEREGTAHYFTSGTFKPGAINPRGGRTYDNLIRVLYLVFDCDLNQYLEDLSKKPQLEGSIIHELKKICNADYGGSWKSLVWAWGDVERLSWLGKQIEAIKMAFATIGLPYSRIIRSGYGHYVVIELNSESQQNILQCREVAGSIVKAVNTLLGLRALDPNVIDPGTRFVRLPGSINLKQSEQEIEVEIIEEKKELDAYDVGDLLKKVKKFDKSLGSKISFNNDTSDQDSDSPDAAHEDDYVSVRERLVPKIIDVLSAYWQEGSTFNLCRSLCGFLRKRPEGWRLLEVNSIIWGIAKKAGYEGQTWNQEQDNLIREVKNTWEKGILDEKVKGISGLKALLSPEDLDKLTDLFKDLYFNLCTEVNKIRATKSPDFMKQERIREILWAILTDRGQFIRAKDGCIYYFDHTLKTLFNFDMPEWSAFLEIDILNSSLKSGEYIFKILNQSIKNTVLRRTEEADVVQLSDYDKKAGCLRVAISDSYYISIYPDRYELKINGEEGIFFDKNRHVNLSWKEFNEAPLDKDYFGNLIVNILNFDDEKINLKGSQILWRKAILSTFFRSFLYTRPIFWLTGGPGSGKTTAAKIFLEAMFGAESNLSEVGGLPLDPLNGNIVLVKKLEETPICCFDNYEMRVPWVIEKLCRYATGTIEEYKILYSNTVKRFKVTNQIIMTSIIPPMKESDLIDRTVFFHFKALKNKKADDIIHQIVAENRASIIKGMFEEIKNNLKQINENQALPPNFAGDFRMIGWAELVMRLSPKDEKDILLGVFSTLMKSQVEIATEAEPLVAILINFMLSIKKDTLNIETNKLYNLLKGKIEEYAGHDALKGPKYFNVSLFRARPTLSEHGVYVEKAGSKNGQTVITITYIPKAEDTLVETTEQMGMFGEL